MVSFRLPTNKRLNSNKNDTVNCARRILKNNSVFQIETTTNPFCGCSVAYFFLYSRFFFISYLLVLLDVSNCNKTQIDCLVVDLSDFAHSHKPLSLVHKNKTSRKTPNYSATTTTTITSTKHSQPLNTAFVAKIRLKQ